MKESNGSANSNGFPRQWQEAFERDASGGPLPSDPLPERRSARLLAAFIATGLAFLALPGTLLGVWNLLAIAGNRAPTAASTAWIQAHGQAQLFGWVGTFILGISLYILPKTLGRGLKHFGAGWLAWALWTAGVTSRWWAGVGQGRWRAMLAASGIFELAGYAIVLYLLVFAQGGRERKWPGDFSSWMGITGFSTLGLALVLNLVMALQVSLAGLAPVYPAGLDKIFLRIALWGFAVPVAWGYSARFVTIFLGLDAPSIRALRWLIGAVAITVGLALAGRELEADMVAAVTAVLAVWALRIFHPPARMAKTLGVYRGYPAFVRFSYLWLLIGAVLGVLADVVPGATGLGGASRHAITVGFIATLIFAIGPRILPAFLNGRELRSSFLMAASLWGLNLGCGLRVASEAVAYSLGGFAWRVLPLSALFELFGVLIFASNLGLTLASPTLVWFGPEGVKDSLPLYWYISSFPKTRAILVRSGLKTLERTKRVPRSLSLAEAAAADGADVGRLLSDLRAFFENHRPRGFARRAP